MEQSGLPAPTLSVPKVFQLGNQPRGKLVKLRRILRVSLTHKPDTVRPQILFQQAWQPSASKYLPISQAVTCQLEY